MDVIFGGLAMIFIAGMFVSFVVVCGTLQAEEEAERRKSIRAQASLNREKSASEGDQVL